MTPRRAPGLLAVVIGVCLVLGAYGVTVVEPASSTEIGLETGPAPEPAPPTTATVPVTAAPTAAAPTTAAPAPPTTAPKSALPARRPTTTTTAPPPRAAAPGVTFTAAPPATPGAPTPSPVPPTASGDSISTAPTPVDTTPGPSIGSFAFLAQSPTGQPARWNPCTPLRYVVNVSEAPAGALALVQEAVAGMAVATGITFSYGGTTNEMPTSDWGFGPSTSFPTGWQPLLIGFARPGQSDLLDGDNAGAAFPVTLEFTTTGELVDVSGAAVIDADLAAQLPMGFGGASVGSIVLHELGHALGLAHVQDAAEVMHPVVGPWTPSAWGPGDREGLRRLGRSAGCTRTVPPAPWG